MKIVHVIYPFDSELNYQEHYLPLEQSKLGHDVTILTGNRVPKDNQDARVHETGMESYRGVKVYRLPTRFSVDSIGIRSHLRDLSPDIIIAHNVLSITSLQTTLSELRTDTPIFVDAHIDNDNLFLDALWKQILYKGFRWGSLPLISRRS